MFARRGVGDRCEVGPVAPNADAHRDAVGRTTKRPCAQTSVCNTNAVGFPGGMCTEDCSALSEPAACGRIAILDTFNACLARNESFEDCLERCSTPSGLRRCGIGNPCRDDYVCAGAPGKCTCIPPYFVFQLRVDGHGAPSRP